MWELHNLASAYRQRPSELFGLRDNWIAWDFDHAIHAFGQHVESELNGLKAKSEKALYTKRRMKLHDLLGLEPYQPVIDPTSLKVT